tara:strand:- start:1319 stop:1660 length:342 start_codon:yes stop_codon:yes gene_type:complete
MSEITGNLDINKWGDQYVMEELIINDMLYNRKYDFNSISKNKILGTVKYIQYLDPPIKSKKIYAIIVPNNNKNKLFVTFNNYKLKLNQNVLFRESQCTITNYYQKAIHVEIQR